MKRFIALILVLGLLLSMTVGVAYANPKGKSTEKDKGKPVKVERTTGQDKKVFKQELNDEKREVQKEISELEKILEDYMSDTEDETVEEEGVEVSMTFEEIENRLAELKLQKKEIINQRFMVTKSEYSSEELGNFDSAAQLIAQMYDDVNVLGLGSVTVRDNIIKFDTPPYIKGGRTVVPVRSITEELGADVLWDEVTQTVTITAEGSSATTGTAIVLGINSKVVTVDGEVQTLDVEAEITNGRTYVPLRFIAETFGLDVDWDADSETIEIEDEDTEEAAGESVEEDVEEDAEDEESDDELEEVNDDVFTEDTE